MRRSTPAGIAVAVLVACGTAQGGEQKYEPLANSVRARLTSAISDRAPPVFQFERAEDGHRWVHEMSKRLERHFPDRARRIGFLKTIQYEATRAGLDPQLVLGVVEVESAFRKYAVSSAGARGYMQVMPFWTKLLSRPDDNLFHLRTNIRYGCVILRHYLDIEQGDYFRALGRYNGSLGERQYPDKILRTWRGRWDYDGPRN